MSHTYLKANVYELPFGDSTVDSIITDPPWQYDTRIPKSKAVNASNFPLIRDEEWRGGDTALQFNENHTALVAVHSPTPLTELYRVLKPGGHLYIFVPERKLSLALEKFVGPMGLDGRDTFGWYDRFEHFNTVIWVKTRQDGQGLRIGLGHTYRNAFEAILCLSKGYRRRLQVKNAPNVLFVPPLGGSIKPAEVYERLARSSTAPGGLIIDPFAGTDPLGRAKLDDYTTVSSDIRGFDHF